MKHNRTILLVLSVFSHGGHAALRLRPGSHPHNRAHGSPGNSSPANGSSSDNSSATAVPPTATPGPVTLTVTGAVNTELQLTDSACMP